MSNNNNKVLLISEKEIKAQSLIQYNVDAKVLSRTILDTQNIYLRPILGNDLFNTILTEVYNKATDTTNTYVIPSNYLTLLEDYIQPYLIHAVVNDVIINLHYKITNKGLLKFSDTSATTISQDEVEYAKNYHDNRTASYKTVLIKYLQDNNLAIDVRTDTNITSDSIGWFLERDRMLYPYNYNYCYNCSSYSCGCR